MQLATFTLNGQWALLQAGKTEVIPAVVPGCVHMDLLANGLLEDPCYRDNEQKQFWIGESDWIYRRTFTIDTALLSYDHVLLRCHGLDTLATIKINGVTLGKTDNMYRTWLFDAKSHLKTGENSIEIQFDSPMHYLWKQDKEKRVLPSWAKNDRLHGGGWLRKEPCNFGWDWGPKFVTSGIWRTIELVGFNARLTDTHIRQQHNADKSVDLHIHAEAEHQGQAAKVQVQVTLNNATVVTGESPISGNAADVQLKITQPDLWWTSGLGKQPLYTVTTQLIDANGQPLDEFVTRIGLRTLTLERHADEWGESFYFAINGVPFFAKGANWIPADTFVSRLTRADYARLLNDTVAGNMNMLRVWGGGVYEQEDFYELCDELGIALWHDFMFACGTYPAYEAEFMANVRAEAQDNVRRLRHHPSIALWCGNNELEQGLIGDRWTDYTMSWEDYGKLFDQLLPEVTTALDPDRPYWPSSPHSPGDNREFWMNPAVGDTHLWSVWHGREPFEWYRLRLDRFCSEFGFQSFPEPATLATFTEPQDRNITSYVMEYHQRSGIGNSTIIHYLLDWFRLPTSFEGGIWLSQIQQGMAMKYACEHWRRNMPRTMGTLYWQLNDCWAAPSWSSIDVFGRWKALHYMAKNFFAPLLISGLENQDNGTVEIHVTSDLLQSHAVVVHWQVVTAAGTPIKSGKFNTTTPVNTSQKVETLDLTDVIQQYTMRDLIVRLQLEVGSEIVSDNLVLFARPKHLQLVAPDIKTELTPLGADQYEVKVTSAHPALWVWLSTPDGNLSYSDNFFHLMPGDTKTIRLTVPQGLSLEALHQQLAVESLIDTYSEVIATIQHV